MCCTNSSTSLESSMNAKELAEKLNGMEYRSRIPSETLQAAKAAGLVIITGASDDLVEFEGALYDELGAGDGTLIYLDEQGIVPEFQNLDKDDINEMRSFFKREGKGKQIKVHWNNANGYTWSYSTEIPHETFRVIDDGEHYCQGLVIALTDLT